MHAWQVPLLPPDAGAALAPGGAALEMTSLLPQVAEGAHLFAQEVVHDVVGDGGGVEVRPLAVEGPPATVLIEAARDADLSVVGSRGHGGFTGLLVGSVSLQAVQHAPCPVVICRHR